MAGLSPDLWLIAIVAFIVVDIIVVGVIFWLFRGRSSSPSPRQVPIPLSVGDTSVVLVETGPRKIQVIKLIRTYNTSIGLKEAKELTEKTPATIITGVSDDVAYDIKTQLEDAGAVAEVS